MNIYIGNLPWDFSEDALRGEFEKYGRVTSVYVIKDKVSAHPLGFGFVEMPGRNQAAKAIAALNRGKLKNRVIMVSEAKERTDRRDMS